MPKKKSKKNDYKKAPWSISKKLYEEFILITDKNKAEAFVKGRILYCIEVIGIMITYKGFFEVDPRLSKGMLYISNHQFFQNCSIWCVSTESMESYQERFKPITLLLEKKKLYFRDTDKIVKYGRN